VCRAGQAEPKDPRSVLEAYVSAWNHHDSAGIDRLIAPDGPYGPANDVPLSGPRRFPLRRWKKSSATASGCAFNRKRFIGRVTLVLYRTRARLKARGDMSAVRAFDKAVRRKPLAFAADAVGLWELHVGRSGERVPVVESSRAIGRVAGVAGGLHR
jgi:hypothetical protein